MRHLVFYAITSKPSAEQTGKHEVRVCEYDIMSAKEKQTAAKRTFVFLASLANEYPAKQDGKIRELMITV